jgi:integrase
VQFSFERGKTNYFYQFLCIHLANALQIFCLLGLTPNPMATFKVLLDKRRQLQNGTYPLVVRIYNGDKFSNISLKTYLKENQFDTSKQKVKKNHPNEKMINQRIRQAILEVEKTTLTLEMKEEVISAEKIKSTIVKPVPKFNFIQFGEKVVTDMRNVNRNGNANAYRDALIALKKYSGKTALEFTEVNYELLCSVENKMLAKGLKKNSIACYNRAWRAIFNKAINVDLVEVKYYPYRKYKVRGEATAKRNIGREDIIAIANMQLEPESQLFLARNYFILAFNLIGISFADLVTIKAADIVNGRLVYQRKKTHRLYNIKLTAKAQELLNYYTKPERTYILPAIPEKAVGNQIEERKYTQYANKATNKYLRQIMKKLKLQETITSYYSRHSWATVAKKMGYSKDMISEALGHSHGSRITEVYLDSFDQEVIDAMNEQVCRF